MKTTLSTFGDYQTPSRMAVKLHAVPLPPLAGKTVLDVGCDYGAWCKIAWEKGALAVTGVDRGRIVAGQGFVDIAARNSEAMPECAWFNMNIGEQYEYLGNYDVVLMLNVYHHAYNVSGDHQSIWHWLRTNIADDGILMWESPVDVSDNVVRMNMTGENQRGYTEHAIRAAASKYFSITEVGPGWIHPRVVWRCRPLPLPAKRYEATVRVGAGGASRAFNYAGCRRAAEIKRILGFWPVHGSLNLQTTEPFDYNWRYFRAPVLDVVTRGKGLDSPWHLRPCRFYPVKVNGARAFAMRFEGEKYPPTLVELIAPFRLRDFCGVETGQTVQLDVGTILA
jgi:SAM-dependent methyltransferase